MVGVKLNVRALVDSGKFIKRDKSAFESMMVELDRNSEAIREPYGSWPTLAYPLNEKRHPKTRITKVVYPCNAGFHPDRIPKRKKTPPYIIAKPKKCVPPKPAEVIATGKQEIKEEKREDTTEVEKQFKCPGIAYSFRGKTGLTETQEKFKPPLRPQKKTKSTTNTKVDSGFVKSKSVRAIAADRPAPAHNRSGKRQPPAREACFQHKPPIGYFPHLLPKKKKPVEYTVLRDKPKRSEPYGTWPNASHPFNITEKRHPANLQADSKGLSLLLPQRLAKKDDTFPPPVTGGLGWEEEKRLKPAIGSWPRLNPPFNTRERRHRPLIPPRPPKTPPEPPALHLDLLKHRRAFPTIKNASQLNNLY